MPQSIKNSMRSKESHWKAGLAIESVEDTLRFSLANRW